MVAGKGSRRTIRQRFDEAASFLGRPIEQFFIVFAVSLIALWRIFPYESYAVGHVYTYRGDDSEIIKSIIYLIRTDQYTNAAGIISKFSNENDQVGQYFQCDLLAAAFQCSSEDVRSAKAWDIRNYTLAHAVQPMSRCLQDIPLGYMPLQAEQPVPDCIKQYFADLARNYSVDNVSAQQANAELTHIWAKLDEIGGQLLWSQERITQLQLYEDHRRALDELSTIIDECTRNTTDSICEEVQKYQRHEDIGTMRQVLNSVYNVSTADNDRIRYTPMSMYSFYFACSLALSFLLTRGKRPLGGGGPADTGRDPTPPA